MAASSSSTVIRRSSHQRIGATVFAVGWAFAAGGIVVLMAWMDLWALVVIAGLAVLAVEVVVVRAARVRLVIEPERLTVANHFRTHRVDRRTVADLEVVTWVNPFGEHRTVSVVLDAGEPVRVEAVAVPEGNEADLDPLLDRLDHWRFGRR